MSDNLPNIDGITPGTVITLDNPAIGVCGNQTYVAASNSVDATRFWNDQITGQLPGYHTYATRELDSTIQCRYNLMEKHKTYKIFSSLLKEYRKGKKQYDIHVYNYYSTGENAITIKVNNPIYISFHNNQTNLDEKISKIGDVSNNILEDCVLHLIEKHSEEFLDLVESELKKDLKNYAEKEGERLKENLDIVDMIKEIE